MYKYEEQRAFIFTDEGQRKFLKIRDKTKGFLKAAGAVRMQEMMSGIGGDSWGQMAYIDRLVEIGDIREVTPKDVPGQCRVFVAVGG